jgi:hypothetical protein
MSRTGITELPTVSIPVIATKKDNVVYVVEPG